MSRRPPAQLSVSIDSLTADGFGSAVYGERVVRVKNALPGERVQARVLKRRRGEWLAEAFSIDGAAALRGDAACLNFPRCGGCAMQHVDYHAQVQLKQDEVLALLRAAGVEAVEMKAPTHGPRYHYRTKARFGVRVVGGEVLIGFRESFSSRVVRMDLCLTLTERISNLLAPLKMLIGELSCTELIPQIEVAAGDQDVALILRHLEPLNESDMGLIRAFAEIHSIMFFGQTGGYETVTALSDSARQLYLGYSNPDYGLYFQFEPADFTQINMIMNRKLVRAALLGLNAPIGARVLELFCGIGNFSLPLAASGCSVHGLEAVQGAIDRARMNSNANGLGARCEFAVRDLYDPACRELGKADYMLLDPPRSGAGPNLAHWLEHCVPQRVAYVSCGPQSFASDARVLTDSGYVLEQVGVFDMFPHTAHIETLGVFQKVW